MRPYRRHRHNNGFGNNPNAAPLFGLLLALAGVLIFLRQAGFIYFPAWSLTWPSILIIVGIFLAIVNGFRDMNWLVLVIIGSIFLLNNFFPEWQIRKFILPIILVSIGLTILLKSIFNRNYPAASSVNQPSGFSGSGNTYGVQTTMSSDSYLKISSILSGVSKKVTSTDFKGGRISCFMGGAEIDLTQADIQEIAYLSIDQVWGGVTLIVPSNWKIESNVSVIMGSVDDRRINLISATGAVNKTLVLNGSVLMAGIEIHS